MRIEKSEIENIIKGYFKDLKEIKDQELKLVEIRNKLKEIYLEHYLRHESYTLHRIYNLT